MLVTLVFEKETKNTVRFTEEGPQINHCIGSLYLKKEKIEGTPLQDAKVITVDLDAER